MAKTDLEQSDLVGPVRTARREYAEWQPENSAWSATTRVDELAFTEEGRFAESTIRNYDGSRSRTTYTYDRARRLTETLFTLGDSSTRTLYSYDSTGRPMATFVVHPDGSRRQTERSAFDPAGRKVRMQYFDFGDVQIDAFGVDSSEAVYGVPGAATLTTTYDLLARPIHAEFRDALGDLLNTVEFTRDDEGRVVKEESRFERGGPMARALDRPEMTAEARVELLKFLEVAFEDRLLSSMTFEYDSQGRLAESTRKFGTMGVTVLRFLYDDRGNVVERVETEHRHEVSRNEATGVTVRGQESSHVNHGRFDYTYDDRNNWTEKIVSIRLAPDREFQRTNVERRRITYWPN